MDMHQKPIVTAIGEILWDVFPGGKRLGGAPANFAYYIAALGAESHIISRTGTDPAGENIREKMKSFGMDPGFLQIDPVHPTGKVTVSLNKQGIPSYVIHENTAWDFLEFNEELEALAERSHAVCFGSLAQRSPVSQSTVRRFLESTRDDCLIMCDINLRPPFIDRSVIEYSLSACDVLKLNRDETIYIAGLFGWKKSGWEILKKIKENFSIKYVAETCGEAGSRLLCPGCSVEHPGFSIRLKDTVGAGDAFAAALTMGFLRGNSCEAINKQANKTASFVCEQEGAWTRLPVEEIIDETF